VGFSQWSGVGASSCSLTVEEFLSYVTKQLVLLNNSKKNYKPDFQLFTLHGNIYSCNLVNLTTNE